MSRKKNNKGFTLIEMLAALLVIVILVVGMGGVMNAGASIYRDAVFESDSANLAGILNTSLGDILRYSSDIKINTGTESNLTGAFVDSQGSYILADDVGFVFTNLEYRIQDGYFYTPILSGNVSKGVLQMKNLRNSDVVELVNTGAYPNLVVTNFKILYVPRNAAGASGATLRGGYFEINYDIVSTSDDTMRRNVSTVVRLMND